MRAAWRRLQKNHFKAHLLAFLLMALPPIFLYYAAQRGAAGWSWLLLGLVVLGNLLVVFIRK